MADRRSMADALRLSRETVSFIQGDATESRLGATEKSRVSTKKQTRIKASAPVDTDDKSDSVLVQPARGRSQSASVPTWPQDCIPAAAHLLVPLTTRLQFGTARILRRACLEQKLKGALPATQQEILEAAIQEWLRQNGYLTA